MQSDTILLIAGAANVTDRMIAYAIAAAERAKSKGWMVMLIGEQFPDVRPYTTAIGVCEDATLADEYAMELCDKVLLLGIDERIEAMSEYILSLYDKELWHVTFRGKDSNVMHKITQSQPEPEQLALF